MTEDPSFSFKSALFDYGISKLASPEVCIEEIKNTLATVNATLSDKKSVGFLSYVLYKYLEKADTKSLKKISDVLGKFSDTDYFAAHHQSIALQAISDYKSSFEANKKSRQVNRYYRPAIFEKDSESYSTKKDSECYD